jgi:solute carrier family 25, member 42
MSASSREQPDALLPDATITSISGSVSGFAATFAKQPIQRIKWMRQIDAGAAIPYPELVRRTLRQDGGIGLFRGSTAGIMRNVPHSMLVYSIYPYCETMVLRQQKLLARDGQEPPKKAFSTRFVAGYATLMAATLVTHPLDTIRCLGWKASALAWV